MDMRKFFQKKEPHSVQRGREERGNVRRKYNVRKNQVPSCNNLLEGVGGPQPRPPGREAGVEEIKTPDIQRPPEHKRPRKTNRGAAAPLSRKELRRVPDEGSISSRGAEARGSCSDAPVSSAGSQLRLSDRAPGREAGGTPPPKWPERAPGSRPR
ncbi:uncharacterized protein LOC143419471 [Maylandia zebra]|uniref:uncharacterized protein LOC143419471 n=1 Tax=Maylandia zebra TaxID=106582 RepID=UPI00403CEF57